MIVLCAVPSGAQGQPTWRSSPSRRGRSRACEGVVAIDGKVLRRSFDRVSGQSPLHMVSAWGCERRMVLSQVASDAKFNEITAVSALLKMLSLNGNQGTLHDDVGYRSPVGYEMCYQHDRAAALIPQSAQVQ